MSAVPTVPLLADAVYSFELPNGEFVIIDLRENANNEWVVEYHDHTNEFISGMQIDPEKTVSSTKQVTRSIPPISKEKDKANNKKLAEMFPRPPYD